MSKNYNNFNKSGFNPSFAQSNAVTEQSTLQLKNLPPELKAKIISYLEPRDLRALACVNKELNDLVIKIEASSINNFIQRLDQHLEKELFQKSLLAKISQSCVTNLSLLETYRLEKKEQLINVIKTLDEQTVNNLKKIRPPKFMEDIFELSVDEKMLLVLKDG